MSDDVLQVDWISQKNPTDSMAFCLTAACIPFIPARAPGKYRRGQFSSSKPLPYQLEPSHIPFMFNTEQQQAIATMWFSTSDIRTSLPRIGKNYRRKIGLERSVWNCQRMELRGVVFIAGENGNICRLLLRSSVSRAAHTRMYGIIFMLAFHLYLSCLMVVLSQFWKQTGKIDELW